MSLIDKLKAGKRNVKIINWPGTEDKVGITVLTDAEIQSAHFATDQLFKSNSIEFSSSTVDAWQSEMNTQVLARALMDPATNNRAFPSADEFRGLLAHPDIKEKLIEEYNAHQTDCSPRLETMTEEQYDALFEDVKKNSSVLNGLSSSMLRKLIIYLASRQTTSPTDSGSTSA